MVQKAKVACSFVPFFSQSINMVKVFRKGRNEEQAATTRPQSAHKLLPESQVTYRKETNENKLKSSQPQVSSITWTGCTLEHPQSRANLNVYLPALFCMTGA